MMKTQSLILCLLVLAFSLGWTKAHSIDKEDYNCLSCHGNLYKKALHNIYIHNTFFSKQCRTCHIESSKFFKRTGPSHQTRPAARKIHWIQSHYDPAKTHFFVIPESMIGDTLFVRTKGRKKSSTISSIPILPLSQLQQVINDGQQPTISSLRFHGVRRGILNSATISWNTDKPTNAQVFYGVGTINKQSRLEDQYKTSHALDISPLSLNKSYVYFVESQDIHGNKAVSKPQTFATDDLANYIAEESTQKRIKGPATRLEHEVRTFGDNYFITLTASGPTFMNIGKHRDSGVGKKGFTRLQKQQPPIDHLPLKNVTDINIKVCLHCHQSFKGEGSHPVNIGPSRGMSFPEDYPVLEDGKIHCMTCHEPHASNNVARIRRPTKQELCLGCHKDYG